MSLALLNSYIELYKIRVQDGLSLQIDLPKQTKKNTHTCRYNLLWKM